MTLQRDTPDGTARYQPPLERSGFPDVFQLTRPPAVAPLQGTLGPARYVVNAVPGHPNLYHWLLQIYDGRGALRQVDRFDKSHAGWSSSTGIDTRFEQVGSLPFLTTGASSPAAASAVAMSVHSAWFPAANKLAVGLSDTNEAHTYLFTETSATNPALVQLTYDKSTGMTCLAPLSVNGTDYMGVGLRGANIRLLSDLGSTPTDAGALGSASSTTAVTAMMQVPLPHSPILLHLGSAFYSGNSDVAIGSFTPTIAATGVPLGGYALGPASFGGGPIRAWWVVGDGNPSYTLPGNSGGGSALDPALFRGRLASTNEYGFDYQETYLPLKCVPIATLIRDGVAASDTDRVIFYNGRTIRDLRIFADVPVNSDKQYKVCGFYVQNRSELFAEVNEIAQTGGSSTTRRAVWRYDFDIDVWGQVSTWTTLTATSGIQSFFGTGRDGTLPVSPLTGFMHAHATQATSGNTWFRQFQSLPGVNPWALRKNPSSATAATGQAYEASAQWVSPAWDIPGLEGWPKIVTRVQGPPSANIAAGGTGAYMTIGVGDGSDGVTFTATEPSGRSPVDESAYTRAVVETIQLTVTAYRATTGTDPTHFSPSIFPITVEGFCYKESLEVPSRWTGGQR